MTKVLVLDAGHGGNGSTAGKRTLNGENGVIYEWNLNNNVCNYIADILKDYDVTIHRTDDTSGKTDVSLSERVKRCNQYNPDLFISIHHNAHNSVWGDHSGTEVYYHTNGTAEDKKVAGLLAPKLASACGVRNRGVKHAKFTVLTCRATAILVEGGFMDSVNDYPIITSAKGQKAYAQAVAEVVIDYLKLTKKKVSQSVTPSAKDSFLVKITSDELNIRKSASFDSKVVGVVKKNEVFTIVEESNGLGKLKSGAGWISMNNKYVQKL